MFQPIAYDQWLYRRRERRTKPISARHFCSRSPMSPSRKWTRKSEKRYNPYLWADLSGKICDKTFISTLHKNYSFVRRLQNCVEWYGPFGPWHPSFKWKRRKSKKFQDNYFREKNFEIEQPTPSPPLPPLILIGMYPYWDFRTVMIEQFPIKLLVFIKDTYY